MAAAQTAEEVSCSVHSSWHSAVQLQRRPTRWRGFFACKRPSNLSMHASSPSRNRCRAAGWTQRCVQSSGCPAAEVTKRAEGTDEAGGWCGRQHAEGCCFCVVPPLHCCCLPPCGVSHSNCTCNACNLQGCRVKVHLQRRARKLHGMLAVLHHDRAYRLATAVQHLRMAVISKHQQAGAALHTVDSTTPAAAAVALVPGAGRCTLRSTTRHRQA